MTDHTQNVGIADVENEECDECLDRLEHVLRDETLDALVADIAEIKAQVAEIHAVMKELGSQIGPVIAQVQSGGIMSMLMGRKK